MGRKALDHWDLRSGILYQFQNNYIKTLQQKVKF